MSKTKIIYKKNVNNILREKNILSSLNSPFIVNMIYAFQDYDHLYFVMDLLTGGDLRYHLNFHTKKFTEIQIKFFISCIIISLEYIHNKNIIHRDIKPENLIFDNNGYLRLTDFGIAKYFNEISYNNISKNDICGTLGYMAPELISSKKYSESIDYYALGVITYELIFGHRPYLNKNIHELKNVILTKKFKLTEKDIPNNFDVSIIDFINKLLEKKPTNRLGNNGINEIIEHPWLSGINWEKMKLKQIKEIYIIDQSDENLCLKNILTKENKEIDEIYKEIKMKKNYLEIFKDFDSEIIPNELKYCMDSIIKKNSKIGKKYNLIIKKNDFINKKLSSLESFKTNKSNNDKTNLNNKENLNKDEYIKIYTMINNINENDYMRSKCKSIETKSDNKINIKPEKNSINISSSNNKNNNGVENTIEENEQVKKNINLKKKKNNYRKISLEHKKNKLLEKYFNKNIREIDKTKWVNDFLKITSNNNKFSDKKEIIKQRLNEHSYISKKKYNFELTSKINIEKISKIRISKNLNNFPKKNIELKTFHKSSRNNNKNCSGKLPMINIKIIDLKNKTKTNYNNNN